MNIVNTLSVILMLCLGSAAVTSAFAVVPSWQHHATAATTQSLYMFSGSGAGIATEDNPEELAQMEAAAKSMGMTLQEYKLGISARVRLMNELDTSRVTAGKTNVVTIERDGNNPPKHMDIIVTEDGKKLGPQALSDELVRALKTASDLSREKRTAAQKGMMSYIGDEMKKLGAY